jgi:HSP20 family protein
MNLVKWTPMRELKEIQTYLNRFFEDMPLCRIDDDAFSLADWTPRADVEETDKEYLIKTELPEIKKEDVKVEMVDGVLTIEGERKQDEEEKGKKFHMVERTHGKFVRQFTMPTGIDTTKVQAEFKDGMLNVHLPKTAAATPKPVGVRVA